MQDLRSYARIQPAVQQIEGHPYFRNNYNIHYCTKHVRACAATCMTVSLYSLLIFHFPFWAHQHLTLAFCCVAGPLDHRHFGVHRTGFIGIRHLNECAARACVH